MNDIDTLKAARDICERLQADREKAGWQWFYEAAGYLQDCISVLAEIDQRLPGGNQA